jgi:hypothetical protein
MLEEVRSWSKASMLDRYRVRIGVVHTSKIMTSLNSRDGSQRLHGDHPNRASLRRIQ